MDVVILVIKVLLLGYLLINGIMNTPPPPLFPITLKFYVFVRSIFNLISCMHGPPSKLLLINGIITPPPLFPITLKFYVRFRSIFNLISCTLVKMFFFWGGGGGGGLCVSSLGRYMYFT